MRLGFQDHIPDLGVMDRQSSLLSACSQGGHAKPETVKATKWKPHSELSARGHHKAKESRIIFGDSGPSQTRSMRLEGPKCLTMWDPGVSAEKKAWRYTAGLAQTL